MGPSPSGIWHFPESRHVDMRNPWHRDCTVWPIYEVIAIHTLSHHSKPPYLIFPKTSFRKEGLWGLWRVRRLKSSGWQKGPSDLSLLRSTSGRRPAERERRPGFTQMVGRIRNRRDFKRTQMLTKVYPVNTDMMRAVLGYPYGHFPSSIVFLAAGSDMGKVLQLS